MLAGVEHRASAVVFKPYERGVGDIGFHRDVAREAAFATYRVGGDDAQPLNLFIAHVIRAPEELVAAADCENDASSST